MTQQEPEELISKTESDRIEKTHETTPCSEAQLKDLSLVAFDAYRRQAIAPEIIEKDHRNTALQLASLRFYNVLTHCPTYAGLILFGNNSRYFLPGNYIQFLQFPGSSITDIPIDQAEISGDLVTMIKAVELRIKSINTTKLIHYSGFQEKLVPDYSEWAVRELLMNAMMHRDYASNSPIRFYVFSDRIEIHNPGGLFGESNTSNFPNVNAYRNPTIAEALKVLGFVNRFGYGVRRAKALLSENGNPEPVFHLAETGVFTVIIYKRTSS